MVLTQPRSETRVKTRPALIDCDFHNELDSIKDLYPYLSQRWRDHLETWGTRGPQGGYYPRFMDHREDARPPSEYIREHVRLTVQPLDAPEGNPQQLLQVVDQLGSEDLLLYASHYPRVHAADPDEALLRHLPDTLARKIRSENARALYGL